MKAFEICMPNACARHSAHTHTHTRAHQYLKLDSTYSTLIDSEVVKPINQNGVSLRQWFLGMAPVELL